jgi:hypothetical protein
MSEPGHSPLGYRVIGRPDRRSHGGDRGLVPISPRDCRPDRHHRIYRSSSPPAVKSGTRLATVCSAVVSSLDV